MPDTDKQKARDKLHTTLEQLLDEVQRPGWFGEVCLRFGVVDGKIANVRREPSRVEKI
jgi:hypothetical protein